MVHEAVELLDSGEGRVAEWDGEGEVTVNQWLKHAVLLLFRVQGMDTIEVGPFEYADKLPLKTDYDGQGRAGGARAPRPAGAPSSTAAW